MEERFKHIDNYKLENAKLFGDRFSAIDYVVPNSPKYLEVGVGTGHYSESIVEKKKPVLMHLLDRYDEHDPIYGLYTAETHEQFILDKFHGNNVRTIKGSSNKVMHTLLGNEYDYIYIDASREFDQVYYELDMAAKLCSPNGVIGVNDYTNYTPTPGDKLEIIDAVNRYLYDNPEWRVLAFQLGHMGYADIYITRNHFETKSLNLHH